MLSTMPPTLSFGSNHISRRLLFRAEVSWILNMVILISIRESNLNTF